MENFQLFLVLESADTLEKTLKVKNCHAIYSKFVLSDLAESLKNLMANNKRLETLILEGLPLSGRCLQTILEGIALNTSITRLSFTRGLLGDDACEVICRTVKPNIMHLNLSSNRIGIRGARSVANLINLQKIQRGTEFWARSLRNQVVYACSIPGLKEIYLNNNPEIGNDGLKFITDVLVEDDWIKTIEMQNCGLSDEGAQSIISCLNKNKTISKFNIAGNFEVSTFLARYLCSVLVNS
jgi:centrosomal protein CEP78